MKKNLRMTGFAKLIKTVAPNTYKHFNCTVEGQLIHTAYLHYDRDVEQVSIGKRAMEWLLQFISKNYTQFLSKDSPKEISNCRGKLENMQTVLLNTDEESGMRLKVTDSEFMKILKEGHFSEKATVLKEWKEMGYLKAQSDRYISRIKIVGDIQVKGYIIQLPVQSNKIGGDGVKDYEEVLEERRKRINKPRQVIKDEYVEDDFFSIDDDDDLDFPEDWK